ncbi:MAG: LysR family transcriptional regulator [Candidatus Rokubacteria bacterium]|nr:LysR family transcriptional regulator [Candidatus Rokubacteria bacterium]MBI3826588.1 LysR family transcriptional regulator [Candidatus Rokubacteria bacterium]
MQLETLRLYCDVVRLRSFSRGAALNFVSQSAASQSVQQLERELGVALLDRSRRPFGVTAEGQTFYAATRELLESWEKAKAGVAAVKARIDGTVRVAAIYSVGLHDMSRHMQRFMSLYPNARVQLECLHPHKVVEAVLGDEADVGVMSYPPADRALAVVPLRLEPMAFVCHPSHRLARRRLVVPADLAGESFVAFDPELTIRRAIDRALRQHNVKVNPVMAFDNVETIKQAIMIAAGVSILPRHTVAKEVGIRTLAAVPFGIPDLVRPVGIIHRRQKHLTPTVSRFIEVLRDAAVSDEPVPAPRAARAKS